MEHAAQCILPASPCGISAAGNTAAMHAPRAVGCYFAIGDTAHNMWRTRFEALTLLGWPCAQRATQLLELCMGAQHQDPDYRPPIHPADMKDSDEDNDGPQSPSSAAEGTLGPFALAPAHARLALAAPQGLGGAGALQALANDYSEVRLLL